MFDLYVEHDHHLIKEEAIIEKLSSVTEYEDIIKILDSLQADGYISYLLENDSKMYWII